MSLMSSSVRKNILNLLETTDHIWDVCGAAYLWRKEQLEHHVMGMRGNEELQLVSSTHRKHPRLLFGMIAHHMVVCP